MLKQCVARIVYQQWFARMILNPMVWLGYRIYKRSGTTPRWAYQALRKLYGAPRNELFFSTVDSMRDFPVAGELPKSSVFQFPIDQSRALHDLREEGISVLPVKLSSEYCKELVAFAEVLGCTPVGQSVESKRPIAAQESLDPRFDFDESDLLTIPSVRKIMMDSSLYAIARDYLNCAPIQDLVAMWWTRPGEGEASSAAAQLFHFDLDRPRFLKVFIFLSDVTKHSGPHVFVRGSHRRTPHSLRKDGRHSDSVVVPQLGSHISEVEGEAGTVFLADTIGLHKGLPVQLGNRLVLQFEYCSSLFGAPVTRLRHSFTGFEPNEQLDPISIFLSRFR